METNTNSNGTAEDLNAVNAATQAARKEKLMANGITVAKVLGLLVAGAAIGIGGNKLRNNRNSEPTTAQ